MDDYEKLRMAYRVARDAATLKFTISSGGVSLWYADEEWKVSHAEQEESFDSPENAAKRFVAMLNSCS